VLGVLQGDADGIAAYLGYADIGDDRGRPQIVAVFGECADQRCDQVCRGGPFFAGIYRDHPLLADRVHYDRVGIELAVLVELLLGEAESGAEQAVEIVLGLRRGRVTPRNTGAPNSLGR